MSDPKEEEEEPGTEDIAIDIISGERISPSLLSNNNNDNLADNQTGDTGDLSGGDPVIIAGELISTVNDSDIENPEGEDGEENVDNESLTIKDYLASISTSLQVSNRLGQERNRRLRELNKILKKAYGLSGPEDLTMQGTKK